MKNSKLEKVLKAVGILVAIGGLVDAIFGSEDSKKIKELEGRIDELENK